ncbi:MULTISPECIES: prepilin peptidase [unclassified Sphingomonas]|uniref:A24 family peptidase n=1 Tax=unclassified Sphingomonas TaxID=196159 RepID=UPI00226AA525|nr:MULTISPECIES: prepilin peptidase [unclassified Sphingomonas]
MTLESLQVWLLLVLGALLVWVGIEDARTREIANWKNAAVALLAPVWWWALGVTPWPGIAEQLLLAAVVFAVFCACFHMGWMGGGDVKLLAALALWLPAGVFLTMLIVMSLAGGVLTLAMLTEQRWRRREGLLEIPYGVAIAFAALMSLREPILNQFA